MNRYRLILCFLIGLWVAAYAEPTPWEADCGSQVTLTASPQTGYQFDRWSDGNTDATRVVDVTGDETYTAYFKPSTATDVDNVSTAPKARKVLMEDKLYIIIGDQLYDATGKRVR